MPVAIAGRIVIVMSYNVCRRIVQSPNASPKPTSEGLLFQHNQPSMEKAFTTSSDGFISKSTILLIRIFNLIKRLYYSKSI